MSFLVFFKTPCLGAAGPLTQWQEKSKTIETFSLRWGERETISSLVSIAPKYNANVPERGRLTYWLLDEENVCFALLKNWWKIPTRLFQGSHNHFRWMAVSALLDGINIFEISSEGQSSAMDIWWRVPAICLKRISSVCFQCIGCTPSNESTLYLLS